MKIDYERHLDALYFSALAMVKNHHNAEDLVQDTIVLAMKKEHQFDGRYPKAWLCRVMYNLMVTQYRRSRRIKTRSIDAEVIEQIFGEDPEHGRDEISHDIAQGLSQLSEQYRTVLVLKAQDLSYKEIAEKIHKPLGTVMSRLCRAREKMKDELRTAA